MKRPIPKEDSPTIAIAAGFVAAGIAVLRAGVWTGAWLWLPLATGVYAVVPMLPLMFAGFLAAGLAIAGWMLSFALLGWALARERLG